MKPVLPSSVRSQWTIFERKVWENLICLVTEALFPSPSNILKGDGVAVELIRGQKLDNALQKEGYSEMSTMETALDFYSTIAQIKEVFSSGL